MNKNLLFLLIIALAACKNVPNRSNTNNFQELVQSRVTLPNGWSLTPIGKSLPLQDLPLNLIVSPSKKYMAVTNNGQSTQSITLLNAKTEQILDDKTIEKSFLGLAFSPDEKHLYASGGNDNKILIYKILNNKLEDAGEIVLEKPWPEKVSPAGLCATKDLIYVVSKDNNSLYILDIASKSIKKQIKLKAEPYTCLLSPDQTRLYISMWGGSSVQIVDLAKMELGEVISIEKNPNDMVLTKDGKTLFVSHGNANSVSVINTETNQKIEELDCSLYPNAPIGSTPNAVALDDKEEKLLIANADNNCLVVFDIEEKGKSHALGFIPTGWYPTSVKVFGDKIFVTNGKGFTSKANPKGPNPLSSRSPQFKGGNPAAVRGTEYIGGLFKGTLSIFDFPEEKALEDLTKLVYQNTPYNTEKKYEASGEEGNPIPRKVGDKSPIKYVFYVIKENRTYDQVLGDVKEGNGDNSLCLFPEKITPNQHAIVKEFVLLDNFYVDAEVSADGHNWSTAAYANDYVEKTWVSSYGGRGGSYDYEGQKSIAYPKDGYIWDFAHRAGVSFRSYGEFVENRLKLPNLKNNYCPSFPNYNLEIKDITRIEKWKADFDSLKAINKIPQMNIIRIGNDHTAGSRLGFPTTEAMVADNDLAVGKLIEYLSNSGIWEESAIFILEDDAQNGSDHVDAHRSTAYVAGGYVKRGYVDHTMYSTSGMLRTMELILGILPMSQYDAAATPMWRCFDKKPNSKPFVARKNNINLDEPNVKDANSEKSGKIDISQPDLINDAEFSKIVWESVKGIGTPMPAPKRGGFLKIVDKE